MKKGLLRSILLVVVAAVMLAFTACGTSIKNFLPVKVQENPALSGATKVTLGTDEIVDGIISEDEMLIINNIDNDTYYLYSLNDNKAVGAKTYTSISYLGNGIFAASKGTGLDIKYGLINMYGEEIESFNYTSSEIEVSSDSKLIRVAYKIYKVENDKKLKEIADSRDLSFGLSAIADARLYGDYIYTYNIATGLLTAYNLKCELIKKFYYESTTSYSTLHDGNVLIKKEFAVADDAKDYTYINNTGVKYLVTYEVYDLKKNSSKSVKFDYYISYIDCFDYFTDKEKEFFNKETLKLNYVTAYEIKDKKLVKSSNYQKGLFVDNSLNIKADSGLFNIAKLADNRFLFISFTGENSYIKDSNDKVIATIGSNYSISSYKNGTVVLTNDITQKCGAIDKDGKVVVEFKYDSLSEFYNGKALGNINDGTEKGYYTVFADGSKSSIITSFGNLYGLDFYTLGSDVYSPNGTKLFNADIFFMSVDKMENGFLLSVTERGIFNTTYYYVK